MQKNIITLLILLVLISCKDKKTTAIKNNPVDSTAIKPVIADNAEKVTYKNAIYYTGRVEFHFINAAGADVRVDISNMPEDSGAVYPGYLLESSDTLEGPPGENPAMVGKPFLLIKNKAGEVREIKPAN